MLRITEAEGRLIPLQTRIPIDTAELLEFVENSPTEFLHEIDPRLFLIGAGIRPSTATPAQLDLLAMDQMGNAVIVAIQRQNDQDAFNQAIVSASLVAGRKLEDFKDYLGKRRSLELAEFLGAEIDQMNRRQRIIICSEHYAVETLATSEWLGDNHGVDICCLHLAMYRDREVGGRYLTCTQQPPPGGKMSEPVGAAPDGEPEPAPDAEPEAAPDDASVTFPDAAASDVVYPEVVEEPASPDQLALAPAQANAPPHPEEEPEPLVGRPSTPTACFEVEHGDKRFSFVPRPWMALSAAAAIIVLAAALMMDGLLTSESDSANRVAASTLEPEPAPQPMLLAGSLEDGVTGQPISGASVHYGSQQHTTDGAGRFQFTREPFSRGASSGGSGEADILVRAAGYRQTRLSPDGLLAVRLEPFEVRAVYLSQPAMETPSRFERTQELLRQTSLNTVIVTVKSPRGHLSLGTAHPLESETGARRRLPNRSLTDDVNRWRRDGVYTIAYIALFRDHSLAAARPELALRSLKTGRIIRDASGMGWTDPAAEDVRSYNIAVAKAAAEAGFDEIQFDFVRYPATPESAEGVTREVRRQRLETIVSFLREASASLTPYNVYVSASVLGSVCTVRRVGFVGQRLEEFASAVDYVSPMLYPSSFAPSSRHPNPLEESFQLVSENLAQAITRLNGQGRKLRPWLQNFPAQESPRAPLPPTIIRSQIEGVRVTHASGWMLWDSTSRYENTPEALHDGAETGTPSPVN